jgi:hypothetical protein
MGFRFRRSIKVLPGVRLNTSLKGVSASIGGKGLRHTVGTSGKRTTVGIPGSGASYTVEQRRGKKSGAQGSGGSTLLGLIVLVVIGVVIYSVWT